MGEWCFRAKAESFAERLWRDGEFLTASGRKNRCEHAFDSVCLEHFAIFSPHDIRIYAISSSFYFIPTLTRDKRGKNKHNVAKTFPKVAKSL